MKLIVLTVRHRVPMGLTVIQFSVKGPVLQIIMMPVMIRGGTRVTKMKLGLGRCGS